jgi:hypothetical protein
MFRRDVILFGALALFLTALVFVLPGSALYSTYGNFSVTPDEVSFNWTNVSIIVTSNSSSLIVVVNNTATEIQPRYFTSGEYQVSSPWPTDPQWRNCFSVIGGPSGMKFMAENATGTYAVLTYSGELNNTNSTTFNLTAYQYCPPGLYSGYLYVFKNGAEADKAKIAANVSIPINPQNTFNFTGRYSSFKGSFVESAQNYHSFYLNKSHIVNSTCGTLKLTGFTGDIDIFLFANASLLYKSIKSSGEDEEIECVPWPGEAEKEMMEIRVYGNVTSAYSGYVYFTPLGAANTSNPNQKFNASSPINLGVLDPNSTSQNVPVNISNIDDQAANSVKESAEVYRVDAWTNKNQSGTYRFLVPNFAEKVKVKIEWTSNTTYNLFLSDVNAYLFGNSSQKYKNANKTGSVKEEFVITTSPLNESNDGYWNITVLNTSAIYGSYNVTAYVWMPEDAWFESSYTLGGFSFAPMGSENDSLGFSFNVTVPELYLTNGTYEGFLRYNNTEGWKLQVPFNFKVKAGMLLMDNENMSSSTHVVRDNIGFDRLGAGAIPLNITYNNTGDYPIYYTETNSSNKLYLTSNTSNYIDFVVDEMPEDGSKINNNTGGTMDIRLLLNTSLTNDVAGTYEGNMTFNTTNTTVTSSSYPFKIYTLVLRVVLTNDLSVNITDITPSTINTENATNITTKVSVKLENGTVISYSNPALMNISDFTGMILTEGNYSATGKIYDLTQNRSQADTLLCPSGGECRINWTIPAGAIGGQYFTKVTAQVNTSQIPNGNGKKILTGQYETPNTSVVVNDTGLWLHIVDDEWEDNLYESTSSIYSVRVKNFGPATANKAQIKFYKNTDCPVSISRDSVNCSECGGTYTSTQVPSDSWNLTTLPGYKSDCLCKLSWELTAISVDETEECDVDVRVVTSHKKFEEVSATIYIRTNATSNQGAQQTTTCTTNATCGDTQYCKSGSCISVSCPSGQYAKNHACNKHGPQINITAYATEKIYVLQGGSNSTKVTAKNTGGYSYTAKLEANSTVADFNASVTPASYTLSPGNSGIFTVDFSVSASAEIGYYTMTVKAYASDNASVYATKDITLAIEPLEQTKALVNQTYDNIKTLFASVATLFNQLAPKTDDANYTLANRTYYRLLNMLQDIENNIKLGNYLEARSLMDEANSSITTFRQQVEQLSAAGGLLSFLGDSNILTLVAILVVIIVIGGFLAYLLLPPKKGYHPITGYLPKEKISVTHKLAYFFTHIKLRKPKMPGSQRTLQTYERSAPAAPAPVQPDRRYAEGYHRLDEFPLSYDKRKLKEKK